MNVTICDIYDTLIHCKIISICAAAKTKLEGSATLEKAILAEKDTR
jgi:hypothetical protein